MLSDGAAAALYQKLFASFEQKLAAATTVYIAPDGILNLVPFARLKLADGRYWGERQEVRLLQTGRDLLRPEPDKPARGLLALGGIDFGAAAVEAGNCRIASFLPRPARTVLARSAVPRALSAMASRSFRRAGRRQPKSRNGTGGCARMNRPKCGRAQTPARRG